MLLAHTVNGGTPSATCWPHHRGRSWLPGLAVSPRTPQRQLSKVLGVSPKWVVQRACIHDALEHAAANEPPNWADLARRLGYADQAHFTNAFSAIVGVPPARYASLGA